MYLSKTENIKRNKFEQKESTICRYFLTLIFFSLMIAANNQNGDVIPLVNVDKVPNASSGIELTLQQDKYKTVKGKRGKRGKRRRMSSIESSPQGV